MKTIRAADLFCGAGGTSTGLAQACAELRSDLDLVAINHWTIAIDTHSANHPDVKHICASLESLDPRQIVPSGRLDLLVASPECTHFSSARGGKPISDQKRASPYLILRWAEALRIDRILVENVPEFRSWGPLGANGKPLKSKKGTLYHHFLDGLRRLGYTVEDRILNAADYGDPTTRRRLFIQARLGRQPIVWPAPTHSKAAARTLFGKTKPWRPAREVIDWSIPGKSIFGRKKPLAEATMRRIYAGLDRFGGEALKPFLVQLTHGGRLHSVDDPMPTVTGAHRGEVALCEPFIVEACHGGGEERRVRSIDDPVGTLPCSNRFGVAQPFIVKTGHKGGNGAYVRSVDDPLYTATTAQEQALVTPFLVPLYGEREGQDPRTHSVDEPVPTIPASGGGKFGVVEPFIVVQRNHNAPKTLDDPVPALCTGNHIGLVTPFLIPAGGPKVNPRSVDDPVNTVLTRDHMAIVEPFLVKFNRTGGAQTVDEPLDTIPTKDRFGLVLPQVDGYVLDVHFRMLQPHELAAAMGFPPDYEFSGNREDKVRQVGNAVPVNLARALCMALLTGKAEQTRNDEEAVA